MSIHVALNHVTHYSYDRLVNLGPQVIRLRPCPHSRTRILSYSLKITPQTHFINWQQDPQGNYLARLVFPEKTREFRFEVDLVAEMSVINPFDFFLEPHAEEFPFQYEAWQRHELTPYLYKVPGGKLFDRYVAAIPLEKKRSVDFLVALNAQVQRDIGYTIRMEPGVQTPEETLTRKTGSCRDSAWLLVQILRHLGLAARFVSGYLIQLTPDVKSLDGPSGPEADFTDLHAWAEVYLPGAGWIGLDPTSGLFAGEGHIPLACTPEPASAAPVTGGIDPCETEFAHHMQVTRVWEAPRVTKPYSDEQWGEIEELGHAIDRQLQAMDVRLTQGGEPTFVASDDPDGAEWNTAALGPTKRFYAAELFHRLREKYASHGLMHFGQGKWYPGEQLPRWSLNCFWRKDGEPLWNAPALYADERKDYGASAEQAGRFLQRVAERLGVTSEHVFPAYEDVYYYLWRERRLPGNVDPFDSRVDDPLERERLAKVFTQGLTHTVGHVLPIMKNAHDQWQSGPWFLRSEHCYLVPGDSPLGYRLPLDSQPWAAKSDHPYVNPPDPEMAQAPLASHADYRAAASGRKPAHAQMRVPGPALGQGHPWDKPSDTLPGFKESAAWITRLAMCAEPRDGKLYIFMPPTAKLEDYLEVVAAVEATAEEMQLPVILEGYEPPSDPRLTHFRVTPDPGVIEVNIHPAKSWAQLVEQTTHLYESAYYTRLTTEKFMMDGRHTGTGGGNHFVLGGATPNDSPFLRRPDLLRSLIAYWHNHPSLSYLFSGLFIGPTSQAPRIDEARNDSLYEMEIAFRQIPPAGAGEAVPPWLVDRVLRNLLIDVSGNTHRAEFCIDKLYSPDGPTGRLGLVEFRAFEMPPHERMSLLQMLLLRALVARFWRQPLQAKLVHWGTALHDRWMLPHFVAQDIRDVAKDLRAAGYAFEDHWFEPFIEFRFPRFGTVVYEGVEMELRQAIEPWNVLGEEVSAGGTARYVDSSVERMQLLVRGLTDGRHVVACNGRMLPLHPTGVPGEYVAGVRFRAWSPWSALHPSIGVQAPLVFDLVDTWSGRSIGGCTYHVVHPGGRSETGSPVNANAAEARRFARFWPHGHTPGPFTVYKEDLNPSFPMTLDLRWQPM